MHLLHRRRSLIALTAFVALSTAISSSQSAPPSNIAPIGKPYSIPRTPWGDPDLQGTYTTDNSIGVPLERPTQFGTRAELTDEEYAEMQKHPVHGARILGNIQSATVKAVLPGVQYHHERWDGKGYPDGLSAEAIPFLGRLLCVADFYDALTSARAYRAAMPAGEAIDLVKKGAGQHFDPQVAEALVRLFDRGELDLDAMPSEIRQILPARVAE